MGTVHLALKLFSIEQLILDIFINGSLMLQCTMDHLTNPIIIGHSGCFHFPILDIVAMNILIHASFTPNQLFLKKYIYRNTYKVGIKLALPQCYCLSPQS